MPILMPLVLVVPLVQCPVVALAACPHGATSTVPAKPAKIDKADKADALKTDAVPAVRTPSTAGLPAPLIALLRGVDGPFRSNEVFSLVPTQPLEPVEEEFVAAEWYAITRGRFVGVVDQ